MKNIVINISLKTLLITLQVERWLRCVLQENMVLLIGEKWLDLVGLGEWIQFQNHEIQWFDNQIAGTS